MFGSELSSVSHFSALEKIYINLLGSPSIITARRYLTFKYFALAYFRKEKICLKKILDFGCAYGGFGFFLARKGRRSRVYLHDDSDRAKMCEEITRNGRYQNVCVLDHDGYEREGNFSLILAVHVLEHIRDDVECLRRLHARLRDDGYLYIDVPRHTDRDLSSWEKHVGHVRTGYDRENLRNILKENGFAVIGEPRYSSRKEWSASLFFQHAYYSVFDRLDRKYPDFRNIDELSLSRRLALAFLWPFYRAIMELDVVFHGVRGRSVVFLAQKIPQRSFCHEIMH